MLPDESSCCCASWRVRFREPDIGSSDEDKLVLTLGCDKVIYRNNGKEGKVLLKALLKLK